MWIMFILVTFFAQVIVFNLLIAIMGNSYNKVEASKESSGLRQKIKLLCDYIRLLKDDKISNYLIVLADNSETDS